MKVLALDFDGVISDSAPECFWVSLRTLLRFRSSPTCEALLADFEATDCRFIREKIVASPQYQKFLKLMPLGNRAEDFGVALQAIELRAELDDQATYDAFFRELGANFAAEFHRYFYCEREAFRGAQPEVWETLSVPFAGLIEILEARSGDVNLAVATAKDGSSVATLLANYGIASLFAEGAVVDKEAGRSKRAHLRTLAERFDVAFDEITFIDDKANHLMETQQLGVRCLLAQWGYNGEREHVVARENGIGVISLDALEPYLFG